MGNEGMDSMFEDEEDQFMEMEEEDQLNQYQEEEQSRSQNEESGEMPYITQGIDKRGYAQKQ